MKTKISQIACFENRADILEMLLEMGIDIQFVDFCGKTPMHYVGLYGSIEVFKLLQNHQPRETVTSLHTLNGYTPLHFALQNGHVKTAKEILDSLEDDQELNIHGTQFGLTPLHYACAYGHNKMVQFLLSNTKIKDSINIRARCEKGHTPIKYAFGRLHWITGFTMVKAYIRREVAPVLRRVFWNR